MNSRGLAHGASIVEFNPKYFFIKKVQKCDNFSGSGSTRPGTNSAPESTRPRVNSAGSTLPVYFPYGESGYDILRGTRNLSFLIYHILVCILNITTWYVLLWKFAISASQFTLFF